MPSPAKAGFGSIIGSLLGTPAQAAPAPGQDARARAALTATAGLPTVGFTGKPEIQRAVAPQAHPVGLPNVAAQPFPAQRHVGLPTAAPAPAPAPTPTPPSRPAGMGLLDISQNYGMPAGTMFDAGDGRVNSPKGGLLSHAEFEGNWGGQDAFAGLLGGGSSVGGRDAYGGLEGALAAGVDVDYGLGWSDEWGGRGGGGSRGGGRMGGGHDNRF